MFRCNVWGTIGAIVLCLMCMTQRHRESACENIPHTPKCSLPSLSLLSPLLLLHRVFFFGDNNALILHCCNPVTKTAKILAQIRKAVALIKAAASSCYAHSHKLEKRKHPAFPSFFSRTNWKKRNIQPFSSFFRTNWEEKEEPKTFRLGHHSIKFAALHSVFFVQ